MMFPILEALLAGAVACPTTREATYSHSPSGVIDYLTNVSLAQCCEECSRVTACTLWVWERGNVEEHPLPNRGPKPWNTCTMYGSGQQYHMRSKCCVSGRPYRNESSALDAQKMWRLANEFIHGRSPRKFPVILPHRGKDYRTVPAKMRLFLRPRRLSKPAFVAALNQMRLDHGYFRASFSVVLRRRGYRGGGRCAATPKAVRSKPTQEMLLEEGRQVERHNTKPLSLYPRPQDLSQTAEFEGVAQVCVDNPECAGGCGAMEYGAGIPLIVKGKILSTDCEPVEAGIYISHADPRGREWDGTIPILDPARSNGAWRINCAAKSRTTRDGHVRFDTTLPGYNAQTSEYEDIQPRHLDILVFAPGYEALDTSVYFAGDPFLTGDEAVVAELTKFPRRPRV